jgi:hypothetical protein
MSDSTSATTSDPAVCHARLEDAGPAGFSISLPGTEYLLRLHLVGSTGVPAGKRIAGVIGGKAQKLHRAHAGGEFIEPVEGHPRIVQGRVRASDTGSNRLLIQAVVPMWIGLAEGQSARDFSAGDFVNFYMESGVTFTPCA